MEDPVLTFLRLHDASKGLSNEELAKVAAQAEIVRLDEGQLIHRMGEVVDALYLVVQGRLKLTMPTPSGEQKLLRFLGPGDQFGLMALIYGEEMPIQVAVDERVVLLKFQRRAARELSEEFPLLRRNLLWSLGIRLKESLLEDRRKALPKLIACVHGTAETRLIVPLVAQRLRSIGENVGILSDAIDRVSVDSLPAKPLVDAAGNYCSAHQLRELEIAWPDRQRVFIDVDLSRSCSCRPNKSAQFRH